jgi:hypothetical protein
MPNYTGIQIIGYGSVTSQPTQVLPPTEVNAYRKDADMRARTLCQVADWTRTTFQQKIGDSNILKVFIAPEFYFRYGGPSRPAIELNDSYPDGEQLLPTVADAILKPFFANQAYADWLIVPGTMFWHKTPQQSDTTQPTYFNTVMVIKGGPGAELTPAERDANAQRCEVPTIGVLSTNQKALMSSIDYALDEDRSHWDAALNPMFALILGDWEWWRYHAFKVHGVAGPTGDPIVFGLEVCLEHLAATDDPGALGVLRTLEQHYPSQCSLPTPEIDVQLVTSCGMTLQPGPGVAARVDGLAVLCDGMQPPGGATWPNINCARVVGIDEHGTHNTALAAVPLMTQRLPDQLQVGVTGQQHNPPDAVSVWETMDLR